MSRLKAKVSKAQGWLVKRAGGGKKRSKTFSSRPSFFSCSQTDTNGRTANGAMGRPGSGFTAWLQDIVNKTPPDSPVD